MFSVILKPQQAQLLISFFLLLRKVVVEDMKLTETESNYWFILELSLQSLKERS